MITNVAITELLASGESQHLELKRSLRHPKDGLKSLCGMLNTDLGRGVVVFGVNPDGSLHGIDPGNRDRAQQTLARAVQDSFSPRLSPSIHLETVDGKDIVIVEARRPRDVPYYSFDGSVYIREGSTKRVLSPDEVVRLEKWRARNQHPGPWACNKCRTLVGVLMGWEVTEDGGQPSYACECGGEFWPLS